VFAALFLLAAAASPHSLVAQLNSIKVLDTTALVPPPGARVAIVEFDDLECPTCARFNPLLKQAAANYRIPWIRHDFPDPLPQLEPQCGGLCALVRRQKQGPRR
jgi:protein-disulfide isomerase